MAGDKWSGDDVAAPSVCSWIIERGKTHQIGFKFPGWATNLIGLVTWLLRPGRGSLVVMEAMGSHG